MNLQQLISQAHANSYYSRSDADAYSAANSAGDFLFKAVQRENRGFFINFSTAIQLVPGTSVYQMPADFSELIHFAERRTASEPYHQMGSITIGQALDYANQNYGHPSDYYSYTFGGPSPFSYDGPYLSATAISSGTQLYQCDIAPAIDTPRMTQLAYIAKWLVLSDSSSVCYLPDEAYPAMLSLTSAALLAMNSDSMAASYRNRALGSGSFTEPTELAMFLSWARNRQIDNPPQVQMFGGASW